MLATPDSPPGGVALSDMVWNLNQALAKAWNQQDDSAAAVPSSTWELGTEGTQGSTESYTEVKKTYKNVKIHRNIKLGS